MLTSSQVPLKGVFPSKEQPALGAVYPLSEMGRQDVPREAFFIQGGVTVFPMTCLSVKGYD